MCLGLEMMRGGDLKILGEVHVSHAGSAGAEPSSAEQGASARKAKGKGKEQEQRVEVETPTDVRVYVDPRCPETRDWLEDHFCRAGCEGRGLRVDMGGTRLAFPRPAVSTDESLTHRRGSYHLRLGADSANAVSLCIFYRPSTTATYHSSPWTSHQASCARASPG